jgi:hypothetical protein
VRDEAQLRVRRRQARHHEAGPVSRSVVDHDDLVAHRGERSGSVRLAYGGRHVVHLVEAGEHDGNPGETHAAMVPLGPFSAVAGSLGSCWDPLACRERHNRA